MINQTLQKIECKTYIVFSFLFLALVVRLYQFGSIPVDINQDGAMAAVDALALATYGTDRFGTFLPVHLTAWGYSQMSALMSYAMIPFIKLLGFNIYAIRLPNLLFSLFGIYALYELTKQIFGRTAALYVLGLAAINPWHILQSRWALECNLFPHCFLFGVLFLLKGLKKHVYLYLSMFFFAIAMYAYGVALFPVPLFLLACILYLLPKRIVSLKNAILCFFIYVLFAWPIFAVSLINFLRLPSLVTPFCTIPFFPNSVRMNDILFFSDTIPTQLYSNFRSLINIFTQAPDLIWNNIPAFGSFYLFSMPFLLLGIFTLFKKYRNPTPHDMPHGIYLLIVWFFCAIATGLIINKVNINRINIIFYPILITNGIGLHFISTISKNKPLLVAIILSYTVAFSSFTYEYFTNYPQKSASVFYDGFGDCIQYTEQYDPDIVYITSNTQYPTAFSVSEILTMYYAQTDAQYYQGIKQNRVPYQQKYRFITFNKIPSSENKNVYFIFNNQESKYFPHALFTIQPYAKYSVATFK